MKLSLVALSALAASAAAAPYQRCMMGGKVIDCDTMADRLEIMMEKYYKAHPEELAKLQQQDLKN